LEVVQLDLDLLFEVLKIDVALLIIESKLVSGVHRRQQNRKFSLLVLLKLIVANDQVDDGQLVLSYLFGKVKHPVNIVVDVCVHN
jgi:hypothetical protein